MTEPSRFAPLSTADFATCTALSHSSDPHPWKDDIWRRSLRDDYCFGLYCGERLQAIAAFSLVLDEGSLLNIVVDRQQRGQGLGGRLLCAGLEWLQQIGAQRCLLEVRESNHSARALYRGLGFTEDGLRKNYYPLGSDREDAVLMSVDLPLHTG